MVLVYVIINSGLSKWNSNIWHYAITTKYNCYYKPCKSHDFRAGSSNQIPIRPSTLQYPKWTKNRDFVFIDHISIQFSHLIIVWSQILMKKLKWADPIFHHFPIFSHIFPYFPISSHIFPYFPISSHIFPYFPIDNPIFSLPISSHVPTFMELNEVFIKPRLWQRAPAAPWYPVARNLISLWYYIWLCML